MVSVTGFFNDADLLFGEIQRREKEAEKCRQAEFNAVRLIQRWVRGFLERCHIARLHDAATLIQRYWRGYRARKEYVHLLKNAVDDMLESYYDRMAKIIQKWWRGYKVRLHIYDHNRFIEWKKRVMMKNREVLHDTKNFEGLLKNTEEDATELEAKEHVLFILFKIHHLLRTKGVPGICSLLNSDQLSAIEEQLKELDLTDYVENLHKQREALRKEYESPLPSTILPGVWHRKCQEFWHKRKRVGKPHLFAQEEYKEYWQDQEASFPQRNELKEKEKPRMKFPPVRYDDRHLLTYGGPYENVYVPVRPSTRPSNHLTKQGFVPVYKKVDTIETYESSKRGPFKTDVSETDLFIRRHQKKCLGTRRKDSK